MHVDETELRIVSKGVDPATNEVVKLYELVIENGPSPPSPPTDEEAEQFLTE